MGILSRLITVVKSNINDSISKVENPKKMLEQIIHDMNEQLSQVKKDVAVAIADEKRLYKSYLEAQKESTSWEKNAMLAVERGDDALATAAIEKQESAHTLMEQYEHQWQSQKEAVDKLKQGLSHLHNKLQEAQRKKNLLIARQKRAEAQQKISKTMSNLTDTSAFDSFARLENKVNEIESLSEAEQEIQIELTGSTIDNRFKELHSGTQSTQAKLEALKAKMKKT